MRAAFAILLLLLLAPVRVFASADPAAIAVLDQEQRWLQAARAGDAKLLGSILAPNFVHTNYRGVVTYREQELASVTKPKPYSEATSEQTVDFFGTGNDVAVVHGLNTVSQRGKFNWMAVSAQETPVTK